MKRLTLLLAVVLCSAAVLQAAEPKGKGDAGKGKEMSGMICYAKCVVTKENKSSCNKNCSEKSGDVVFVDHKGSVMKIENQDRVMPMAGKKVKVKGTMSGDMMHVDDIAAVTY